MISMGLQEYVAQGLKSSVVRYQQARARIDLTLGVEETPDFFSLGHSVVKVASGVLALYDATLPKISYTSKYKR